MNGNGDDYDDPDFLKDIIGGKGRAGNGPNRWEQWEIPPEYAPRFERCVDGVVRDRFGNSLKRAVNSTVAFQIVPPREEIPDIRNPWVHDHEPSERLEFVQLADNPAITREWAVPGWFPILETVGFGGPGGEGKTLLAHQLATAHALGHNWLGLPVEEMRAALVLCEDRHDDAYLRQADINKYFQCRMADLEGRLLVLPRRKKQHNYLGIFDADDILHTTTFFDDLVDELSAFGARCVVLDGRSDIFWGDQNHERHARSFVRQITDRIAERTDGYVLLLYQPSRAGKADGSGESGSAQWDAAFRGRALLDPARAGEDPTIRRLIRKKSNFSPKNEEIEIRWKDGVFWRTEELVSMQPAYERAAAASKSKRVFLHLLRKFAEQNRQTSSTSNSVNYAPKLFAAEKSAEGCKQKELEEAMRQLFDQKKICNVPHGPPSHARTKIALVNL